MHKSPSSSGPLEWPDEQERFHLEVSDLQLASRQPSAVTPRRPHVLGRRAGSVGPGSMRLAWGYVGDLGSTAGRTSSGATPLKSGVRQVEPSQLSKRNTGSRSTAWGLSDESRTLVQEGPGGGGSDVSQARDHSCQGCESKLRRHSLNPRLMFRLAERLQSDSFLVYSSLHATPHLTSACSP